MNKVPSDTRKLLKVFGVAITDFEDACDELTGRVREIEDGASDELVATLRDLIVLIAETNESWLRVTNRLFATQQQLLVDMARALPE